MKKEGLGLDVVLSFYFNIDIMGFLGTVTVPMGLRELYLVVYPPTYTVLSGGLEFTRSPKKTCPLCSGR